MDTKTSASPKVVLYDCGICGACHPWDWDGDCRDDENRLYPDEWAAKLGVKEWDLEIRSMSERVAMDEGLEEGTAEWDARLIELGE